MSIERLVWTAHAQQRIQQRRLDRHEVEQAISEEVWDASTRLPANLLEALPAPEQPHSVAA